jgi:hypothetical protein
MSSGEEGGEELPLALREKKKNANPVNLLLREALSHDRILQQGWHTITITAYKGVKWLMTNEKPKCSVTLKEIRIE